MTTMFRGTLLRARRLATATAKTATTNTTSATAAMVAAPKSATRLLAGTSRFMSDTAAVRPLKYERLVETTTTSPRARPDPTALGFGIHFADHMLEVDWTAKGGWDDPRIHQYQNFSLEPSCSVFHYAMECFEGMKAYHGLDGKTRLFRPDMNAQRFRKSCNRLTLPDFDPEEFVKLVAHLVAKDKDWIPTERGQSLYLRPTMIATMNAIGVGASTSAKMFVITSPVGGYFSGGQVTLLADTAYVRAWPGGMGDTKCGGNYAPTILPQQVAKAQGCDQVLWLFGEDQEVTEVGTMNLFVHWVNENSENELITAPLDGTILEGVTRRSIIDLVKERIPEVKVSEKMFTMPQLKKAIEEKRVKEIFGAGTAATVSIVKAIKYMDNILEVNVPSVEDSLAEQCKSMVFDIQYGIVDHPWAPVVAE